MLGQTEIQQVAGALEKSGIVILTAPTGFGKTSAVVPAVAGRFGGHAYVLGPRRLAAVTMARYVRRLRREEWGEDAVGYMVRYDHRPGKLLTYATDGELPAILARHPGLSGVSVLAVDEFHERRIWQDVAVAVGVLQRRRGVPVRLLVISATAPARDFLSRYPDAEWVDFGVGDLREESESLVLNASSRIDIEYFFDLQAEREGRPSAHLVDDAVADALRRMRDGRVPAGDILVFLPGLREIEHWARVLSDLQTGVPIIRMHSTIAPEEMDPAFQPGHGPRIILASSIAQTSITLPHVTVVIDDCRVRTEVFDMQTGTSSLQTRWATRDVMIQRAGRAARTEHASGGLVYRLCSPEQYRRLEPFQPPEILQQPISQMVLSLEAAGIRAIDVLHHLPTPPPSEAVEEAAGLLRGLGALDARGDITPLGRRMAMLPVDPRFAWMILRAAEERPEILDAFLMGMAVFAVNEGRLRIPGWGTPLSGSKRKPGDFTGWLAWRGSEAGSDLAAMAILMGLYLRDTAPSSARHPPRRAAAGPEHGDVLQDAPETSKHFRRRLWDDLRMDEAEKAYQQLRQILRRVGVDIRSWHGDLETLRAMRPFLAGALMDRLYFLADYGGYIRFDRKRADAVHIARESVFGMTGIRPPVVAALHRTRAVTKKRRELELLYGVVGVRIPEDLDAFPAGALEVVRGEPHYDEETFEVRRTVDVYLNGQRLTRVRERLPPGKEAASVFARAVLGFHVFPDHIRPWCDSLRHEVGTVARDVLRRHPDTAPAADRIRDLVIGVLERRMANLASLRDFRPEAHPVDEVMSEAVGRDWRELVEEIGRLTVRSVDVGGTALYVDHDVRHAVVYLPPDVARRLTEQDILDIRNRLPPWAEIMFRLVGTDLPAQPLDIRSVRVAMAMEMSGRVFWNPENLSAIPLLDPILVPAEGGAAETAGWYGLVPQNTAVEVRVHAFATLEEAVASTRRALEVFLHGRLWEEAGGDHPPGLREFGWRWLRGFLGRLDADGLRALRDPSVFEALRKQVRSLIQSIRQAQDGLAALQEEAGRTWHEESFLGKDRISSFRARVWDEQNRWNEDRPRRLEELRAEWNGMLEDARRRRERHQDLRRRLSRIGDVLFRTSVPEEARALYWEVFHSIGHPDLHRAEDSALDGWLRRLEEKVNRLESAVSGSR